MLGYAITTWFADAVTV